MDTKCVFWFPLLRLSDAFHIIRRTELDIIKYILVFMQSASYFCAIFMIIESSRKFSKNSQISNLGEIRLVGEELIHVDSRMDRHDEVKSSFTQFFERP